MKTLRQILEQNDSRNKTAPKEGPYDRMGSREKDFIKKHEVQITREDYKAFFKKALTKYGVDSIEDIPDSEKDDFFDYVDQNYKAKGE